MARAEHRGIVTKLASGDDIGVEKLLFAAGRSGATAGLGLEAMGVEVDKRGHVEVDAHYRPRVPHVYAAGDVIGFPALASTSMEQARVAVCHAFGWSYKQQVSELLPYGIYTIPEVSCGGRRRGGRARSTDDDRRGPRPLQDNARGKIIGDNDGIVKLVFDKQTRKLIGCHCLGDRATELVHIGQAVIMLGGTVDTFIEMVFNYPTLARVLQIRGLRRARQVRQTHLATILVLHRELGRLGVCFFVQAEENSLTPNLPVHPSARHSPTIGTKHRSRASRSSVRSARTSSLPPPRSTMPWAAVFPSRVSGTPALAARC